MSALRILMIDNYDSFTYNLVQYFCELGAVVEVKRNDEITLAQIGEINPDRLVISPGPCSPRLGFRFLRFSILRGKYRSWVYVLDTKVLGLLLGGRSCEQRL